MLRLAARLFRNCTVSRPRRDARKTRLRLDDLEVRSKTGNVVNGLFAAAVGARMGEPIEVMAALTGDVALLGAMTQPTANIVGVTLPFEPEPSWVNRVEPVYLEDLPAEKTVELQSSEAEELSFDVMSRVSILDIADIETLSFAELGDPDPFLATVGTPEAGGGTGGAQGLIRPDTASQPTDVSAGPRQIAEPDQSIAETTAFGLAPETSTTRLANDAASPVQSRAREVYVTPPSRQSAAIGTLAQSPRVWVEAVQTATGHGFRVWRDGSSGSLSVRYRLTESSTASPTVDHVEITNGNRSAAVVVPSTSGATLTVLADHHYTVAALETATVDRMLPGAPTVTVRAESPAVLSGSEDIAIVTFTRTTAVGDLEVKYTVGGTAVSGVDYHPLPGTVVIPDGETRATIGVRPTVDAPLRGHQTVRISVAGGDTYNAAPNSGVEVTIQDPTSGDPIAPTAGIAGGLANGGWSSNPVRYWDGKVWYEAADLVSFGFGGPWGVRRSWSNVAGYANNAYIGSGWVDVNAPRILAVSTSIQLIQNGSEVSQFDLVSGAYVPQYFTADHLAYDFSASEFVLTDGGGNILRFSDPTNTALPVAQRGQLSSFTDAYGTVTQVMGWRTDGKPTDVQRAFTVGGVTTTESFLYGYVSGGTNDGLLAGVTLRRKVGSGSWSTIREVNYGYYDGTNANGNAGDLESATVKDSSSNTLTTEYYRYYKDDVSGGFTHGLKYAFRADSYARLAAWCTANSTTVSAATDAQIDDFADHFFEYDPTTKRAIEEVAKGAGSSASGGLGTFTFAYSTASGSPTGLNEWARKTVETLPDGNQNIVYTNYAGGVVLSAFKEVATGDQWITYHHYDSTGRLEWTAYPSAVTGYNDTYADLLNFSLGTSSYLRDDAGLFELTDYYTSTTATSTTAGSVSGYYKGISYRRGELGTAVPQDQVQYYSRTVGSRTIYPFANATAYRNDNGTGGRTTSVAYTWGSGFDVQSQTITLPAVTTGQYGSGTAATVTTVFDGFGNTVWTRDPDGYLQYRAFDIPTGAVTKAIDDVDATQTTTFTGLPSGWNTPTGGGLHLTTTAAVDTLGRATQTTDPSGNVSYVVFDDPDHELRVYPAWNTSTNSPTGPTIVARVDMANGYSETLTMSATPSVSGGVPTGTESISSIQTLSREHYNTGGQLVNSDEYYDLTGLTYSTAASLGTEGTHFNRARYGYNANGQLDRAVSPTSTVYRTWFDALGRVASEWVGTDDTPTSGAWGPTNTAGADLVKTAEFEYDLGTVGDGNLTSYTAYPGGGAAARQSDFYFDWRNRLVAVKDGVESSESTSLNRPIQYLTYNNLDEVTKEQAYDGDGVTLTTTNGVPNAPSSSLLRAEAVYSLDELGQVYRTQVYSVDPSTGSVSTNSLTADSWFDNRGNLIKAAEPGGLVAKATLDGLGRVTAEYLTDGGGDTTYSAASNVTGDIVLSQSELSYDANSNLIAATTRDRFHNATGTGALGTPTSGVGARVSYAASYVDALGRPTSDVDVGTNGGSTYSRPSSAPSRSDTTLVTSFGYNAAGWESELTDPRGLTHKTFYDRAGRVTKTIENYVDGIVSDADDKTVEYTYNANGDIKTLAALLTGGGSQTTENVFGVSTSGGLVSNDLAGAVRHPDSSTGSASSSEQETYTYNQLGEVVTATDRNGTVHAYSYDVLGRLTADAVTTLGSGVDGTVRRVEYAYDGQGNTYLITSYDAVTGGNVVNQVQRAFDGLGNLVREWQATSGTVNTSTTPSVQYAYAFAPSGSSNTDRLTSITYPNGRVITYNYASGLPADISRLSSITDGSTTLESYEYLGLGTVVKQTRGNGVNLDYSRPITGHSGAAVGDVAGVSGSGGIWRNPQDALTKNNQNASVEVDDKTSSEYLDVTDFDLSIPAGATVTGVTVNVTRNSDNGYVVDEEVRLILNGTTVGDNKADTGTSWPTLSDDSPYGGVADDWNAGLTAGDVNDPDFGVRIKVGATGADNAYVDRVEVTVNYSLATGEAGDQYTGLDRFGRVIDQAWLDGAGNASDRWQYGYNRDSNRAYRENLVSSSRSELYAYDNLGQLTAFDRGTLNGAKTGLVGSASRSQDFDYDALGNWDSLSTNGGSAQTRTHNKQNEITAVAGATTPTYDANGNLTTDETGQKYKYDAWNQLVEVRDSSNTLIVTYRYDALARRVRETRGSTTTDLYYSDGWQVLEERVGSAVKASYVWSPVYVDALIARDRDSDHNGSLDERLYALQDANWNTTALVNTSGVVVERYLYDPFGSVTVLDGSWAVRSGGTAYGQVYLWQGLRRDPDTGLYHARHRDVSPTLGRPLQRDPIGFEAGDANVYRWEGNRPTGVTDPSGLSWRDDLEDGFEDLANFGESLFRLPGLGKSYNRSRSSMRSAVRPSPSGSDMSPVPGGGVGGGSSGLGALGQAEQGLRGLLNRIWDGIKELIGHPSPTPWPDFKTVSDRSAGWADSLSYGLTKEFRDSAGYGDAVDTNSAAYRQGETIGDIHGAFLAPGRGALGKGGRAVIGGAANKGVSTVVHKWLGNSTYHDRIARFVNSLGFRACFVAGTPIRTPDGSKPIEEFRSYEEHGDDCDYVLTRNEFDPTGPVVARRVLQTFVRVSPVLNLHVGGRLIGTTAEHPFYVVGEGWLPAAELRIGDWIVAERGSPVHVDGIADSGRVETVYNFEVEDDHTYFVGEESWGWAAWAHNRNYVQPNGPGELFKVWESMSKSAASYQQQTAGLSKGYAYLVRGVKFDGYKGKTLLDSKGRGYLWRALNPNQAFEIGTKLLKQARDQLRAAKGTPIKWIVAEKEFAAMLKSMFKAHGIPITVAHKAMRGR